MSRLLDVGALIQGIAALVVLVRFGRPLARWGRNVLAALNRIGETIDELRRKERDHERRIRILEQHQRGA